jgi:hypothetical protein
MMKTSASTANLQLPTPKLPPAFFSALLKAALHLEHKARGQP